MTPVKRIHFVKSHTDHIYDYSLHAINGLGIFIEWPTIYGAKRGNRQSSTEREGDRDVLGTEHEPSALSEHHGNHEQSAMSVYME